MTRDGLGLLDALRYVQLKRIVSLLAANVLYANGPSMGAFALTPKHHSPKLF
jgi:hypothetical protein